MNFKEWLGQEIKTKINETDNLIEVSYVDQNIKGYIHAEKDNENPKIYRVNRVSVTPTGQGYGKKLYLIALNIATKKGAMLAPAKLATSDSALNIWKSLYKSSYIKKIPLSAKDWGTGPRHERVTKKYPNLRYRDISTYPPKEDLDFWILNSGYISDGSIDNTQLNLKLPHDDLGALADQFK
jgi:hypothetical protein